MPARLALVCLGFFLCLTATAVETNSALSFLKQVQAWQQEHGKKLASLKANLILGPLLDVGNDEAGRNYSDDACAVSLLGEAVRSGWQADGKFLVAPKHFPGLGSQQIDTHQASARFSISPSSPELMPFQYSIASGAEAILVGHGIYPAFEKNPTDTVPAPFSKALLGYLRQELHFDGLVIIDDVLMGAVLQFYEKTGEDWQKNIPLFAAQRVVDALQAGADSVMVFYWQKNVDILKSTNKLFQERIAYDPSLKSKLDQAVKRILTAKKKYFPETLIFQRKNIPEIMQSMSLEQKVAQMLFFWYPETEGNAAPHVGAYRFASDQLRSKAYDQNQVLSQQQEMIPSFIAIDQRKNYLLENGKFRLVNGSELGKQLKVQLKGKNPCSLLNPHNLK